MNKKKKASGKSRVYPQGERHRAIRATFFSCNDQKLLHSSRNAPYEDGVNIEGKLQTYQ